MKAIKYFPIALTAILLSSCGFSKGIQTLATDEEGQNNSTEVALSYTDAYLLASSIQNAQKLLVQPNKLTLTETVHSKEIENSMVKEEYDYEYVARLDYAEGYYRTNLKQESKEWNNTLQKYINYTYDIENTVWTTDSYKTYFTERYIKYEDGIKIEDSKIYAEWNMGYYEGHSTVFGKGKVAALMDVLNHFFSGRADVGEEIEENDFGEYVVKHMFENFKGTENLADAKEAAKVLSTGKQWHPFSGITYEFCKANFTGDSQDSSLLKFSRQFAGTTYDSVYKTLHLDFDQEDIWQNNLCVGMKDKRKLNSLDNAYVIDQTVADKYSTEEFSNDHVDPDKEGYIKLDLTY
ncbi:MAG: hypothetical protein MJ227_01035 [Bacilli bacterium]|nr:hypothetical protein [Bacilli bacterium]